MARASSRVLQKAISGFQFGIRKMAHCPQKTFHCLQAGQRKSSAMQTPAASSRHTAPRASDRALVARLLSDDAEIRNHAWNHIYVSMVKPLVKSDVKGIRSQCERAGVPTDAIFSRMFANLTKNNASPLRAFRFECAFKSWIYWHVWDAAQGAIREIAEKVDVEVSDNGELPTITDTKNPTPDRAAENVEFRQTLNGLLAALWKENPRRAVVLLLRGELELSSRDVGAFLGKEPANVDQIHHHAQASMRRLRLLECDAHGF